jgi:hypothetical protein
MMASVPEQIALEDFYLEWLIAEGINIIFKGLGSA